MRIQKKAVFQKRSRENLLLWLHIEAEGRLGLALLVGDDERVLPGVRGRALHHIKADLSIVMVNVVVVRKWSVQMIVKKTKHVISDQKGNGSYLCQLSSGHHLCTCIHCT